MPDARSVSPDTPREAQNDSGLSSDQIMPIPSMVGQGTDIVVVDDSHETRVTLRETLEDEGYSVATACTGREALALLRSPARPRLALVDLMMPIMDGWELTRAVRADRDLESLPLILITATEPDAAVRALADGFLKKPLAIDALLELVERYCPAPS